MEYLDTVTQLNLYAVAASTVAMIVAGSLWYSPFLFGKAWIRLSGIRPGDIRPADVRRAYIVALIVSLVTSALLGLVSMHAGENPAMLFSGVAFIWLFVMMEQLNHVIWERQPFALFLLQTFRSLAALMAGAAVFFGTAGGTGYVMEYAGSAIRNLSIEGRMTVCNMSIEAGARAGLIAPDEKTFEYFKGRPFAPKGADYDAAVAYWKTLPTDEGAHFDTEISIDAASIEPQVTWGTSPQDVLPITASVPALTDFPEEQRESVARSMEYMGLTPGTRLEDISIDKVFIGSCTNGRIEDLREVAKLVAGHHVAPSIKLAMVVPGSGLVKEQAEKEGLDKIFTAAGFEWREAGCSMCLAMNNDRLSPGERCASTSNRNFEGRQGRGGRTHLMSPAMAAAAAIKGTLTDVRKF